jgi:hypothetical protein
VAAAVALAFGYAAAKVLAPLVNEPSANTTSRAAVAVPSSSSHALDEDAELDAGDGDLFIGRVLEAVERRPNIAAKVRHTLSWENSQLIGQGEYWQQGVGNARKSCWRLVTGAGDDATLDRQVLAEGRYLWNDHRVGEHRTVTRIDVGRLVRELNQGPSSASAKTESAGSARLLATRPELMARGGLAQLVADLARCFRFGPRRTIPYGGAQVTAVVGRWRHFQLARVWPDLVDDGSGDDWPDQLPHHVLVLVGEQDLFPYLIEYRSGAQARLAESALACQPAGSPLACFEFYGVQFAAPMPGELFEFPFADVVWQDVTGSALERVRLQVASLSASLAQ